MKTTLRSWKSALVAALALPGFIGSAAPKQMNSDLVVHEWGTFTSLQSATGELIQWRPLTTSRLPEFVYDWRKPGLDRIATGTMSFAKGEMLSLQRMETPVIYFYTDREQTANVLVRFPQGRITEWYPQAQRMGPSAPRPGDEAGSVPRRSADDASVKTVSSQSTPESLAEWKSVRIVPAKKFPQIGFELPLGTPHGKPMQLFWRL
jgi:hypothetical protein